MSGSSISPLQNLLPRLDGVRQTGGDTYTARCPGHDDAKASLSVREAPDGRLLLFCFAGCSFAHIARAVGMSARDFHPPHLRPSGKPQRPDVGAIRSAAFDALVVQIVAEDLLRGRPPDEATRALLAKAVVRLHRLAGVPHG